MLLSYNHTIICIQITKLNNLLQIFHRFAQKANHLTSELRPAAVPLVSSLVHGYCLINSRLYHLPMTIHPQGQFHVLHINIFIEILYKHNIL